MADRAVGILLLLGCELLGACGKDAETKAPAPRSQDAAAPAAPVSYKVLDSHFASNRRLAGSGTGARLEYADIDPSFLQLVGTTIAEQTVATERDQTKRHYLHPVTGTAAARVGAGLFTNPIVSSLAAA